MKVSFTAKHRPAADVIQGIKVPYAQGRRAVFQWRWYLILTLVSSPFFYLLFKILWPYLVLTAPGFISLEKETVTAVAAGLIRQVHVQVGDAVAGGQVLLDLGAPKLEQRIRGLRMQLESPSPAPAVRQEARSGGEQGSVLALYRQQLDHAAKAAEYQQQRLVAVEHLFDQGAATAAEVNSIRAQRDTARHTLIQAQLDLASARDRRSSPPPESEHTADLNLLAEQLRDLEAERQQLQLRASQAGIVLDLSAVPGRAVEAGEVLAMVGHRERPQVIAYLRPQSATVATVGRYATVTLPGGPSLHARVREAPTQARRLPADLSSVIGTRDVMVLVVLEFSDPFPTDRAIENLPVDVRFHRFQ